ncbi:hypothetical protein JOL62DRAFT_620366 [Phyllosticta paracitricarpa]|uniref:Protein kinase domain-containing protein n=1 Tax=Phyllosticta paracitricarpa TaxID=2016321 RepID=A0ABR1N8D9_9PEZI
MSASLDSAVPQILCMKVDPQGAQQYRVRNGERIKYPSSYPRPSSVTRPSIWLSSRRLNGVNDVWNDIQINVLDLQPTVQLNDGVFETLVSNSAIAGLQTAPSTPELSASDEKVAVVAKIAPSNFKIGQIERETRGYQMLQQRGASHLGPRFLGHVHEGGCMMGFLLEKLEGRSHTSPEEFSRCEAVLGRLHELGLSHRDIRRDIFLC